MRILCKFACLIALSLPPGNHDAGAMDVSGDWEVREGRVSYEVSHLLHGAVGRSRAVRGTAQCKAARCSFRLTVPLATFDSGDAERDRDMLAVTQAGRFPAAVVEGTGRLVEDGTARVQPAVLLAGRRVPLEPVRLQVERGWWRLHVQGSFAIALSAFGIERPALLGVPISDTVWIHLELTFASG